MTVIDLSKYPAPKVVEDLSFERIHEEVVAEFLAQFPEDEAEAAARNVPTRAKMALLLTIEGNLLTKLLQAYAYHAVAIRARINDAAKATMLTYAVGTDLDNLAAFYTVERKQGEADDVFRKRIVLAVDGFSTAGPVGAYQFHALSADDDVKDITVESPVPGEVVVTVLSRVGNGVPSRALLDTVNAALGAEDVRPLTDQVTVQAATVREYTVEASIWCYPGADCEAARLSAKAAVEAYVGQIHLLGFDVTVSGLLSALHQPGVQRAEVSRPANRVVNGVSEAAFCTAVAVTHEGVDV